jgi:hypothetical protein
MTGEVPDVIDHIDGIKSNNAWRNLRVSSHSLNQGNCGIRSTNSTGYKGVYINRSMQKFGVYFLRKQLGFFDTPEEAHRVYCDAAAEYFGDHARFT